MVRMNRQQKIDSLTKFLKIITEDDRYFIKVDEINGKRFALFKTEEIGHTAISDFMSYKELDCYFFGMLAIKQNRITW